MNARLERNILLSLEAAHPRMLPLQTTFDAVKLVDSETSFTAFRRSLEVLETLHQVVVIPDRDAGSKIQITTEGLARLSA